jgi:hypothetical protein
MSKVVMISLVAAGLTLTTGTLAQAGQNDSSGPKLGVLFQAFAGPGWGAYGAYGFGGPGPGAYAYAPKGHGFVSERNQGSARNKRSHFYIND